MSKIKLEDIRKAAKEHEWNLISEEYKNLNTEMVFECNEKHRIHLPYKKIRDKWECPICQKNQLKKYTEVKPKPKDTFRILALDQATKVSGYSIFDNQTLVAKGTFKTTLDDEIARDNAIKNWLISMVEGWQIDLIGLEDIQFQKFEGKEVGVTTYKTLAHLQGILMETCFENNWDYVICAPATWRSYNKVKGRTRPDQKKSMQRITKELFDITVSEDEADAIGIGKYLAESRCKRVEVFDWE